MPAGTQNFLTIPTISTTTKKKKKKPSQKKTKKQTFMCPISDKSRYTLESKGRGLSVIIYNIVDK